MSEVASAASRQIVIAAAKEVLSHYDYQITVRQLYYRLVAALVIENSQHEYKRLVAAMTAARKKGAIRPTAFADPTRRMLGGHGWLNLRDYLRSFRDGYFRDPWQDQANEVWVMVEKEALASVFEGPCRQMFVPLMICRGYPSISSLYVAAQSLARYARLRTLHVLYFGDHDPSGKDIDRNIGDEIDNWSPRGSQPIGPSIKRIALTWEQIEEHGLPPMPEKATDSRTAAFQEIHGAGASVELDALDPDILDRMVRDEIERHIDSDVWQASEEVERAEQERLHRLIDRGSRDDAQGGKA